MPGDVSAMKIAIVSLLTLWLVSVNFYSQFASYSPVRSESIPSPTPLPKTSPSPVQEKDDEVIKINTDIVTLTATVIDKNGRPRTDLKREDFNVYEDGALQKLEYFNTGDRIPMSLGIVFDTSGSMEDKIEGVRDAVEHFVKSIAPGDEIFVVNSATTLNWCRILPMTKSGFYERSAISTHAAAPRSTTPFYLVFKRLAQGKTVNEPCCF